MSEQLESPERDEEDVFARIEADEKKALSGAPTDTLGPDTGIASPEAARERMVEEGFDMGPVITDDGVRG
ncbi:hypothetical protein QJ043_05980 [Olsenella sp. YH-ols2217]|uniref:Uncharacterized protein n=1 Tax=Kribbibacterium absianum TaxID=3044210 RepID=A0ABT6ZKQ2_9ACTN|nr:MULTISPECIES: hypothetical protein [unclassified Olsenella]MDJ1121621.1 hypothetical protein [Olsenella sp. YH-ols2216]MDJ1129629.1 hypothetical protein [Olsenella sp. YH-ols2217]